MTSFAAFAKSLSGEAAEDGKVVFVPKHLMIFGPPKTGKTAAALLLAKQGYHVYFIDIERGGQVAVNPALGLEKYYDNIRYFPVFDTPKYPYGADAVDKIMEAMYDRKPVKMCIAHGLVDRCTACGTDESKFHLMDMWAKPPEKTVLLIDSATQLGNSIMALVMAKALKKGVDDKPEFDQFGAQGKRLNHIFSNIQAAPFNIIVTSHDTEVVMEDDKKMLTPTAGTRNFSSQCARYFSDVVYIRKGPSSHTGASNTLFSARVQLGSRLGAAVEDFNVPGESILLPIMAPAVAKALQAKAKK